MDCLVFPIITERLPQLRLDRRLLKLSKDQKLADPDFDNPDKIDLLIGAGLFWNLLCIGQIKTGKGCPIWQRTQLGWVIGGELNEKARVPFNALLNINQSINKQVERFWNQEEVQEVRQLIFTLLEKYCEDQFAATVSRDSTGFIVALPKNESVTIGNSRENAVRRFHVLERRFRRQPDLKKDYVRFMEEYKELAHMKLVDWNKLKENTLTCFLPHHPVTKADSLTTRVRVVFDASAKTDNGY